ncbi:MAG: response regulator transcription factor [Elusimicrobia bacterium]|nr:response regulator transcription factor [Elusimicrobiota bacterium]
MDKILIVNDNSDANSVLKFRLESVGFYVDIAESGEEGVRKAKLGYYQLILLDCELPDIKGEEVCKILKAEENSSRRLNIVFMSGKEEEFLHKITIRTGAKGYISMPFKGEEFTNKIKKFMVQTENSGI